MTMERKMKLSVRDMVMVGVMAAVTAVLSQISIPSPTGVPMTMQTLAVALSGYVLGGAAGVLSVAVYLALGAVGLPVFSGFGAGVAKLVGVTGGFLWGFLVLAFLCGVGAKRERAWLAVALGLAGLTVCHVMGITQFAVLTQNPWPAAAMMVSVPYLVKDVVSVAVAALLARRVRKALHR